jgi:peptide deformylase
LCLQNHVLARQNKRLHKINSPYTRTLRFAVMFTTMTSHTPVLLPILHYPDPRLHTVAKPVTVFDDALKQLVANMALTMYEAPGVGLAATQINVHQRLLVVDVTEDRSGLKALINPVIAWASADLKPWEEGCLSVPGVYEEVQRPDRIRVKAFDTDGKPFELEADGLLSVCIQHEIDHLNGKVFVQYLSKLKQTRLKNKILKAAKEEASA